ncbi:nucleoside deaminase [Microbacterium esteraromaticum]|uniref:nucleoside deaminase n=1 Tax=Microbacterium esteraromaticum TaxID=57043 RepID=UPI00195A5890|nr:nucleoside deaminase [Microbacterium esteraromaticum]MBM7467190.1 cytosine deaminase [Microbacterium esteraromaticum]
MRAEWMQAGLAAAVREAEEGIAEGGMPFGAAILHDGEVIAVGRNRQVQRGDFLAHAETEAIRDCLGRHGRVPEGAVLVATEGPCAMCAGAALITGFNAAVVGEVHHFAGHVSQLRAEGVDVEVLDDQACIDLVTRFRADHADLWARYSAG